jgi:hypothetical protein
MMRKGGDDFRRVMLPKDAASLYVGGPAMCRIDGAGGTSVTFKAAPVGRLDVQCQR